MIDGYISNNVQKTGPDKALWHPLEWVPRSKTAFLKHNDTETFHVRCGYFNYRSIEDRKLFYTGYRQSLILPPGETCCHCGTRATQTCFYKGIVQEAFSEEKIGREDAKGG